MKFSLDGDLPPSECLALLSRHMPSYVKESKITERMFIQ